MVICARLYLHNAPVQDELLSYNELADNCA